MIQYQKNKAPGVQYNLQESVAPGFNVYQARVKVKNPSYTQSVDTAIFAKNPQMARMLLQAQFGKDSVITNITQIA